MTARLPSVRHFIACHDAIAETGRRVYSLQEIIQVIYPAPSESFPLLHPQLCLFAILTHAQGKHSFCVQIVTFGATGEEHEIWRTSTITRDLGPDPLVVHGWPIRLRNLRFERAGVYEFRLLCADTIIARESISVRE